MRKLLIVTVAMQFSLTLPLMVRGNDGSAVNVPDQADQSSIALPPPAGQDSLTKTASDQKKAKAKKKGKQVRQKQPSGTQAKKNVPVPRLTTTAPVEMRERAESPAPKPVVSLRGATPAQTLATPQEMKTPADK